MGLFQSKDGTAQGVAKARHMESLYEPSQRLFYDPYAHAMFPGAIVQQWIGVHGLQRFSHFLGFSGMFEMLAVRTKWLDDEILRGVLATDTNKPYIHQLVILGAGYDTRGFRLEYPKDFKVFEVDQPSVQTVKRRKLEGLAQQDKDLLARLSDNSVVFVPVDFNTDNLEETLAQQSEFEQGKPTVVTLEGVTQYIPKTATADTLTKLHKLMAPGSKLLVTYVTQDVLEDPEKCGSVRSVHRLLQAAHWVGEPWISVWSPESFREYLEELGYDVVSDTTTSDYNDKYLVPLGRGLKEEERLDLERYVVATRR